MPLFVTNHDFTHGQLDKSLKSRSDLEVYKKGALEIKNMVVKAGGSAKSRFGTTYIATGRGGAGVFPIPDDTVIDQAGNPVDPSDYGYQIFEFSPTEDIKLLVILGQGHSGASSAGISNRFTYYVVKNDTGVAPAVGQFLTVVSPTTPPAAEWVIDNNQVVRIKYRCAQNQNNFIICTSTRSPLVLTFDPAGPAFVTARFLDFRNYPQHDFTNNAYTVSTFQMTIAIPPDGNIPITGAGSAYVALNITAPNGGPGFEFGAGDTHYVGGCVQALGPISDTTSGATTVLSTSVLGVGIIEAVTNNLQVLVRVISPFDASLRTAFPGTQLVLTEPSFSDPGPGGFPGRGWPRCTSFYENRLILAGTREIPQSVFMSRIGNFQDFNAGTGEADDGIAYTIASGDEDEIINLVSGRSLEVFTTTNEFSAPVWSESGLTPSTVTIRRQTSIGSANCIPAVLDNMTVYTKRGGRAVMAYTSENTGGNTFNSIDASIYSTELIDHPIHMTSFVENEAYDSNVLLVINEGTGESARKQMVMLESLREQNVVAWTTSETDGEYENVEAVGSEVFFIVKRNIGNAGESYTFEQMNWNICLDSGIACVANIKAGIQSPIYVNPLIPAGNLPEPYWGKTIYVVGYVNDDPRHPEGVWIDTVTVGPAGAITVTIPETPNPPQGPGPISPANPYFYWIGLNFEQLIQTMPLDVQTQMGNMLFMKKKIFKAYVQYIESYPFYVNGIEAPLRSLAVPPPALPPGLTLNVREKPYSGIYMTPTMQKLNIPQTYYVGWTREATVLITTNRPLPVTIQGITSGVG